MFYKQLEDNTLTSGPFVQTLDYTLDYNLKDTYPTPLPDGWFWFDTDEEANTYFGIE